MNDFSKYLLKFKNITNSNNTHLYITGGKYIVPDNKSDEFFTEYNKAFLKNEKLHVIEVHKETGPIVIDIDMRFSKEKIQRQYKDIDIITLVKSYNKIIKKFIKVSDKDLQCFIFEKKKVSCDKSFVKDGIHIMYPHIHTYPDVQYVIRENIIKMYHDNQTFKHLDLKNTLEDVFDKSVIYKNGWLMYGSSKSSSEPYKLTRIFDSQLNEIPLQTFNPCDLPKLFSIRRKSKISKIQDEHLETVQKMKDKLTKIAEKKKNNPFPLVKNKADQDVINDVQSVLKLLDKTRADNYNQWIELGWCLHNIDHRLLTEWIEFSKLSEKYDEGKCEQLWNTFRSEGFTIGTIYYWAKIDNIAGYSNFLQQKVNNYLLGMLKKGEKCTHYDIAKIVEMNYRHTYVCASLKYDSWYEFNGIRWAQSEKGHCLRKLISSEIADEFSSAAQWLLVEETHNHDDKLREGAKHCIDMIKQLRTRKYKDDIMTECKELLYDKTFTAKLDSNIYLMGFENGVYDLKNQVFRPGSPNDYVSFTTGINYMEYDENNVNIGNVMELFRKIQPDSGLFDYLLTSMASYLDGQIADEKFIIWTGTGSNGKSLTVEFFEQIFGDYCTKLPISLLTRSRGSSSAASPEIAKTQGKRFGVMQEPEEQDRINVGLMKEITGGDKIEARGLYKDPVIFKPQFKLLLTCNELPKIPSNDGGTWRRLRVLPFKSEFVDDPTLPHQFKKDPYLCEKLEEWGEAFMSILIHYYKIYSLKGLVEPSEVLKYTKEYRKDSDIYCSFIDENIEELKLNDKAIKTTMSQIYAVFKDWYRENHPDTKCPIKTDVKKYFEKKYGKARRGNGGYWSNIKIKMPDELSDTFDDI